MASKKIPSILLGISFCVVVSIANAEPLAAKPFAGGPGAFGLLADADHTAKGDEFRPEFGNWFDFDNPGWGLDIQRAGDLLFVIWFTYRPDGTPIWYVVVGELDDMSWTGDIQVFKWDPFGTPGSQATASTVGTMTIVWSDETNATASWTLNGTPGSADVSFAAFAGGPTLANLTGHYFPFFAPGWGFTLLTQGEVTVLTMYFYKDGQPTWLQGVVVDPGFLGFVAMNYFFGPGLCPSCLGKRGQTKANFDVTLTAEIRYEYAPGNPQETALNVEEENPGSPLGLNPFGDIFLGIVPRTGSSFTGAYMNRFLRGLERDEKPPVPCIAFRYRQNLMSADPMPTGPLDTHYFTSERNADGNHQVFNDANCLNAHMWMARHDGLMYQSWIQSAPTNKIETDLKATQQKWFIQIPDAFQFGEESCDLEEGIGTYGVKQFQRIEDVVTGFTLHATGVINYDLQKCTDMFSFVEYVQFKRDVPRNQEFIDDRENLFMVDVILTF